MQYDDPDDRRNRFLGSSDHAVADQAHRAASQPPRYSGHGQPFLSSPQSKNVVPSSLGGPWGGVLSSSTRSSSFSSSRFESTLEDDELLDGDDDDDDGLYPQYRGRTAVAPDLTRSRSHSLATQPVGSGRSLSRSSSGHGVGINIGGGGAQFNPNVLNSAANSYSNAYLYGNNAHGHRYSGYQSRYGSLGAGSPLAQSVLRGGGANDNTNMSPFMRDVSTLLLDESSSFRELWNHESSGGAGRHAAPDYDLHEEPDSGATSRRHSVTGAQPLRFTAGFNAPESNVAPPVKSGAPSSGALGLGFGRGGQSLLLSDDDLEIGLGNLSLSGNNNNGGGYMSPTSPRGRYSDEDFGAPPPPMGRAPSMGRNGNGNGRGVAPGPVARSPSLTRGGAGVSKDWADAYFSPPQQHFEAPVGGRARATSNGSSTGPVFTQFQQQFAPHPQQAILADLGKGLPLHAVPPDWPLYIVEFKAGRTDLFYRAKDRERAAQGYRNGVADDPDPIRVDDFVIVEADRGKDLGKVINDSITLEEVEAFWAGKDGKFGSGSGQSPPTSPGGAGDGKKEICPKMIYGKAGPAEAQLLVAKMQDEAKALALCQSKVRAKKLPMEVVDAEYQWDRRKLTFYFVAEKRIDFRELVRELFRLYKTRIWMASLQGAGGFEQ